MKKVVVVLIAIFVCNDCLSQSVSDLASKAESGDVEAMFEVGQAYCDVGNYEEAYKWWEKAALAGDTRVLLDLAGMSRTGTGTHQDYQKAFEWYSLAANNGDRVAMYRLGLMCYKGDGVQKNIPRAIELWEKAAEMGDVSAMYNLGWHYDHLSYHLRNIENIMKWYGKAAEKGHVKAMTNLGICFLVDKLDDKKAFEWLSMAIENGDNIACVGLGYIYYKGTLNFKQDYEKAFHLFNNAIKEENATLAIGFLSEMYYYGYYVEKDYNKAFKMAKEAAEKDGGKSGTAMRILSACYRYGMGGAPKDNEKAKYWLDESAKHKDEISMRLLF